MTISIGKWLLGTILKVCSYLTECGAVILNMIGVVVNLWSFMVYFGGHVSVKYSW